MTLGPALSLKPGWLGLELADLKPTCVLPESLVGLAVETEAVKRSGAEIESGPRDVDAVAPAVGLSEAAGRCAENGIETEGVLCWRPD